MPSTSAACSADHCSVGKCSASSRGSRPAHAEPGRLPGEVAAHLVGVQVGLGEEVADAGEGELPAVAGGAEELLEHRELERPPSAVDVVLDLQPAVERRDVLRAARVSTSWTAMSGLLPGVILRNTFSRESSPNLTEESDCSPEYRVECASRSSSWPGSRWKCCGRVGASEPSAPRRPATTRSGTTPAPSGRTTPRSPRGVSSGSASGTRRAASAAACSRPRASSTTRCPRCSRATRARRRPFPSRTRRRPAPRPGGRSPILCLRLLLGLHPDPSTRSLATRADGEAPDWLGSLTLQGVAAFGKRFDVRVVDRRIEVAPTV